MSTTDAPTPEPGPLSSPFVIEATRENFEAEVVGRSKDVPVVVDFWAEWCGPCKALGPTLEALAQEFDGRFVLVKADTDALPEYASAFGVKSIPAVFGLRDGRVVDRFVGALPEPAIRSWLERLFPTPAEQKAREAKALEGTDPAAAEAIYREALALTPNDRSAQAGLARSLVRLGRFDEAQAIVKALEGHGYFDAEVEAIKAEIALKSHSQQSGGADAARAALAASPDDPSLRLALAEALAASGAFEEALEICLALVEAGRKPTAEPARLAMLNVFQLLPPDSEMASEYRRKLSAALY